MKKFTCSPFLSFFISLLFPVWIYGASLESTIPQPTLIKYTNIGTLISNIISFVLIAGVLIFFFMLLFGGIQWMTAGGDKVGTQAARGRITMALIGLLVVFASWAVMMLLETFFGIYIFKAGFIIPSILNPNPGYPQPPLPAPGPHPVPR